MATVYGTLLAERYFPKELPPNFLSEHFAMYAGPRGGGRRLKRTNRRPASGGARSEGLETKKLF